MPDVQAPGFDAKPAAESALVVGQIESVVGVCSLTRPGGDPFQAKRGDPVCRGDILETTAGGKIGIRFIDGTAFNLSDSARAVVKEFGGDGNEPSALFDISRGTFAFIAGEMAKHGRLRIETPFASIRGRAQSGGIGMLSLASLFFAALENAQASGPTFVSTLATPLLGTEDGIINIRESSDIINAQFGIIELTVGGQTIFIDNPFFEWIVRGTSVSQVPLSLAQLAQHQVESNNVSNLAGMGQGPTVGGPSGSSDAPPPGPPPFVTPITFVPTDHGGPPNGGPNGGSTGGETAPSIFIPPPVFDEPPAPPGPPLPTGGSAAERPGPGQTDNPSNVVDTTTGSLAFTGVDPGAPSFDWSGGFLTSNQTAALTSATSLTFTGPGLTGFEFSIQDHALDLLAATETLTITYNVTLTDGAGHTLTQPVVIVANGANDAPSFTSPDPDILRIETTDAVGNPPTLIASGSLIFRDVDLNDVASTYSASITGLAVSGATSGLPDPATLESYLTDLQITKDAGSIFGHVDGQFAAPDSAFNYLSAGETVTLKYTVQIDDGHGGTGTQFVTVTIQGTNEAPIVTGSSVTVSEEGLTGGIPDNVGNPTDTTDNKSASGQINISDPDADDALTVTLGDPGAVLTSGGQPVIWTGIDTSTLVGKINNGTTTIVTVTIDNSGNYTVTLGGPIDHLDPSSEDIKTISVPVAVSDGHATTLTTLLVTIDDDAPTATSHATQNVAEGATVTGTLAFVAGADGASVTHIGATALVFNPGDSNYSQPIDIGPGLLKVKADGSYSFTADPVTSSPVPLATATLTVTDGDGDTATATVNFQVTDANAPTGGSAAAAVDDDGLPGGNPASTINDLNADTDGDGSEATFTGQLGGSVGGDGAGANGFSFADLNGTTGTVGTETVTYHWTAGTHTLTAMVTGGARDGINVFQVQITNPATGAYKVTLLDNVIHATGPNDENASDPTTSLAYTIKDADGTPAAGTLTITFDDDAPTATSHATQNVAEGATVTGTLAFVAGADGASVTSHWRHGAGVQPW